MVVQRDLRANQSYTALSTIPALMYTMVERVLLHMNTTIMGARYWVHGTRICRELILDSIWVFTLVAMEAVKTYKTNPQFVLSGYRIPTWITPLLMLLFVSVLVPNTSLLGHICGLCFGYGCKSGFVLLVFLC